jgi:biotin transport system substrate-specific component
VSDTPAVSPTLLAPGRVLSDVIPGAKVRDAALVVGSAILLAASAQVAVPLPFTPVPITGQTFAVMLIGASCGALRGLAGMTLYVAVGFLGAPVFSPDPRTGQARTGEQMLAGVSFGYILGMALAVVIVGWLSSRNWDRSVRSAVPQMILGNLVIYAVGVPWLGFAAGFGPAEALAKGLVPFLIGDAVKIALAAGLLPAAWRLVGRASHS